MTSVKRPPKQIRPLVPGMNIDYIYKVKICRSTLGAPIESTCLQPNWKRPTSETDHLEDSLGQWSFYSEVLR